MGNRPARAGAQNAPSRSRSRKIHKRHGTVRQQALTAQGSLATTLYALGELDEARQLQEAAWSGPGGCSVSLEHPGQPGLGGQRGHLAEDRRTARQPVTDVYTHVQMRAR